MNDYYSSNDQKSSFLNNDKSNVRRVSRGSRSNRDTGDRQGANRGVLRTLDFTRPQNADVVSPRPSNVFQSRACSIEVARTPR